MPRKPARPDPGRDAGHELVIFSLHDVGALTRSNPAARYVKDPGSADIFVLYRGCGIAIEVKTGDEGMPFSAWRANQREWAERWCRPTETEYWLWWLIRNPGYGKRQAFLIPFSVQNELESYVRPIQNSLPQYIGPGFDLTLQERGWDLQFFLKGFETPIVRNSKGDYILDLWDPDNDYIHPFIAHYGGPEQKAPALWTSPLMTAEFRQTYS